LEISENWKTDYPYYWKYYSFLKRKIYKYDYSNNQYTNELKENGEHTIYVIFNKTLNDAVCCDVSTIATFTESSVTVTHNLRQDTFLREPLTSNRVVKGLSNCIMKIKEFIKSKE
jgi:hypothetical protein